ncbi:MAG: stress response translation initiation inhibitor YciH [Candidatus Bathyarchaeota archaeon]|nr:stress response translation initiation inhibitor YciH [Candidatus Bathyarchaeota archaeon]
MAEICPVCGLPKDLCVCEEISKEQQRIRIRLETRKWGKKYTIIDGIDPKDMKLSRLAATLKSKCACGGTAKNDQILLQGDHRDVVKAVLVELGFPSGNIEVQ